MRLLAGLLCLALVRGQGPIIFVASYAPVTWSTDTPCPQDYPNSALGRVCGDGALRLELLGANFDAATFDAGCVDVAFIAPPTPAPVPIGLPSVLQLADLQPFGGGCLLPSDAANAAYSVEVCPYGTSYLRARGGGERVASLGVFSGVIVESAPACNETDDDDVPPQLEAAVGLRYSGGDVCGSGTYSATVSFVCINAADPWQLRYLRNATVNAASVSADGCTWALSVPLSSACFDEYDLCNATLVPGPIPSPAPRPQPIFMPSYISSWTPGRIIAFAPPGALPAPSALRVRRFDGVTSAPLVPVAKPLPPSATPIPMPFPAALTVIGAFPSAGLSSPDAVGIPCTPVTISLGGVLPSDLAGLGASFDIIFPQAPGVNTQKLALYGSPSGVPGGAPGAPPPSGRLDLQLDCAPKLLTGFATPYVAQFTVRSRFQTTTGGPFFTRRTAVCENALACSWTFWGPNGPPPPRGDGAASALSPAALNGIIGGASVVGAAIVGAAVYLLLRARGACGGGAAGAAPKAAAPAQGARQEAWGAGAAVSLNPAALAAGGESLNGGAPPPAPKPAAVAEWGAKAV